MKLVPKFSESDVETFLLSFEKVAELNSFPPEKHAAILQAHLTGKALKVFTELSVEECRDYPTLKLLCFRRTPSFLKSTGNASEVSISSTLRLILSMLSA